MFIQNLALPLIELPEPHPTLPPGLAGPLQTIVNWTSGVGYGVAVLIVIGLGIMFLTGALEDGRNARLVRNLIWIIAGCVLISSAALIVRALLG